MDKSKRNLWIGLGVGAFVGFGGGFIVGNAVTKKRARRDYEERIKKIRKKAYDDGLNDGIIESQKWIDENVILVDAGADVEEVKKQIDEHIANAAEDVKSVINDNKEGAENVDSKALKEEEGSIGEGSSSENSSEGKSEKENHISKPSGIRYNGQYVVFTGAAGTELYYPRTLIFDPKGDKYSQGQMMENFRAYENDIKKLQLIWNLMGWGIFSPGVTDSAPTDEDINDWDLSIGDEAGLEDEPAVKTEERRKYLEKLKMYTDDPNYRPKIVSKKDFDDEAYLKQMNIDYYPVDNVFIYNDDITRPIDDPFNLLGTSNGQELFAEKQKMMRDGSAISKVAFTDEDEDPDIVYVENFAENCIMEVTRYPGKAYEGFKDGSVFL